MDLLTSRRLARVWKTHRQNLSAAGVTQAQLPSVLESLPRHLGAMQVRDAKAFYSPPGGGAAGGGEAPVDSASEQASSASGPEDTIWPGLLQQIASREGFGTRIR
jgi:hypothetical protein